MVPLMVVFVMGTLTRTKKLWLVSVIVKKTLEGPGVIGAKMDIGISLQRILMDVKVIYTSTGHELYFKLEVI